jgi:hypothetical protein
MPRTIITHVGASLLSDTCVVFHRFRDREALLRTFRLTHNYDAVTGYIERATTYFTEQLGRYWKDPDRHRKVPAEIASLSRLDITEKDTIVLLHSDTNEGAFCAKVIQAALSEKTLQASDYPYCAVDRVSIHRINGLRVTELPGETDNETEGVAERFVSDGLTSYIDHVWTAYKELAEPLQSVEYHGTSGQLIFNVTAGYKGMIPLARDLAQLLAQHIRGIGVPITSEVCYLYEESDTLITFASLPIQFDWWQINEHWMARAAQADPTLQLAEIDQRMRQYFDASKTPIQLSPLGRVVWELGKRLDYGNISLAYGTVHTDLRASDDYYRLKRQDSYIVLPGGLLIGLVTQAESKQIGSVWQVYNSFGVPLAEKIDFTAFLAHKSYLPEAEAQAIGVLQQASERIRQLLRYGGALIEHLYLSVEELPAEHAEQVARLCRLLITFWQQDSSSEDREQALPALWHSYRAALSLLVEAQEYLRQQTAAMSPASANRRPPRLLDRYDTRWLEGWQNELEQHYDQARDQVAQYMRTVFRTILLHVEQQHGLYRVELQVEGVKVRETTLQADWYELRKHENQPLEYGEELGKWLFAENGLGSAYGQAVEQIRADGKYARVLLATNSQHFYWESIFHPWLDGTWQALTMSAATPFARTETRQLQKISELQQRKLRLLVIISSPKDIESYEGLAPIPPKDKEQYHHLFDNLRDITVNYLESNTEKPPTLKHIRGALANQYDIVHIICHGRRGEDDALFLENDAGEVQHVSAAALVSDTSRHKVQLYFLAACRSAERPEHNAFTSFGQALIQKRAASAVIAMNGLISMETARQLTLTFYRQLMLHRFVELALNQARQVVRDAHDWSVPVLFLP